MTTKAFAYNAFLFLSLFLLQSDKANAQTTTAKIILVREGMHEGSAVACSIFMNEELLCKLNNKRYSTHDVAPGRYSFHSQWGGTRRKDDKRGDLELTIEEGKTYYIKFNIVAKAFNGYVGLLEITESTFIKLKDELKPDDKCL